MIPAFNKGERKMNQNERKLPAHEIRIGTVKASIWSNETKLGTRFGVTLSRIYKAGESWKRTSTFDRDDLLTLRKVLDQAHSWICQKANTEAVA
jgi:hypothetical protein